MLRCSNRSALRALVTAVLFIFAFFASGASAQLVAGNPGFAENADGSDVFELDENAQDSDPNPPGAGDSADDWDNVLCNTSLGTCTGSNSDFPVVAVSGCENNCDPAWPGVLVDPEGTSIFVTGSKDSLNIPGWQCRDQASPDKNELVNAYAIAYDVDGDLVVNFGTDRKAQNGTAVMGFWLLQSDVALDGPNALSCIPAGDGLFRTSSGDLAVHAPGDVLVVSEFTQGGALGEVVVFVWDTNADNNLREEFRGDGADCGALGAGDVCAVVNQEPETAPWPYLAKTGETDFPRFAFMEGAVNLSTIFGEGELPCFSTFLAETRTSTSKQASQKDFVIGNFPVCAGDVSKICENNTPNLAADPITFTYDVAGCIDNTGFGSLVLGGLTDDPAFDASTLSLCLVDAGKELTPTQCDNDSPQGLEDIETAIANDCTTGFSLGGTLESGRQVLWQATFTSGSNGGDALDTVTASLQGTNGAPVDNPSDSADCPSVQFNPNLTITKDCDANLVELDNKLVVNVDIFGNICNPGEIGLTNITVTDSTGTTISGIPSTLPHQVGGFVDCTPNGHSVDYSASYFPDTVPPPTSPDALLVTFRDTITVTGDAPRILAIPNDACEIIGDGSIVRCTAMASADCNLCPGADAELCETDVCEQCPTQP